MAEDLLTYLAGKEAMGFEPRPYYSPDGDFLTFFFREDDHYAERVDDLLTVYHSMENHEPVGYKIKGVRLIFETLGEFGVEVEGGEVSMGFLFLSGALSPDGEPEAVQRDRQPNQEHSNQSKGTRRMLTSHAPGPS